MTDSLKTRIPPALMASLYRDSLVHPKAPHWDESIPSPKTTDDKGYKTPTTGGFGKSVLILVSHPGGKVMPDKEGSFLTNILKACRLSMEDVLIVNAYDMDASERKSLVESRNPAFVLMFGMEPTEVAMPISFPSMKVQRHGQAQYLHASGLDALQTDDAGKRALWGALKQMFAVP